MLTPAPILLFTYKRLESLRSTIEALKKNPASQNSDLFIFSDGPKKSEDVKQIDLVRSYLGGVTGFKTVNIKNSDKNKGLANSIIQGVTEIMNLFDRVIVLEDDLLTTPNFLDFMNSGLNTYSGEQKIFSISGYSFNLGKDISNTNDAYFLNRGWSWGWATWKDRWEKIDWEVGDFSEFSKNKTQQRAFARGGSDLNAMLAKQMNGTLDSWAIRWFYHQYKVGGLTLYPLYSKVYNNGFDAFATHTTGSSRRYLPLIDTENKTSYNLPDNLNIDKFFQRKFQLKMGLASRILSKLEGLYKNILKKYA